MKTTTLLTLVLGTLATTIWLGVSGCDDDDFAYYCTAAGCAVGSPFCCPESAPGVWNATTYTCTCPGADADADADPDADPEAGADADADADAAIPCTTGTECPPGTYCTGGFCQPAAADADADADPTCPAELGGPCNPVRQCGCAADRRCVIALDATPPVEQCILGVGTGAHASYCSSNGDCAAGSFCYAMGYYGSRCIRYCYTTTDCPGGTSCIPGAFSGTGYGACDLPADGCNVYTGSPCPIGACLLDPATGDTYCVTAGSRRAGEVCDQVNFCSAGFGCYATDSDGDTVADGDSTCYQYCDLAGTSYLCPAGSCQNIGHASIGVCY